MPAPPQNNFDFIVNPPKKTRKGLFPSFGGGGFLSKIILIVGGAIGLMAILWVVTVIFGSPGVNIDRSIGLVQSQEEIIRVANVAEKSIIGQDLSDASATAKGTIVSQQSAWNTVLLDQGVELKGDQLELKTNPDVDEDLESSRIAGTFDETYAEVLETMLRSYATEMETFFDQSENTAERERLAAHFAQVGLLLEQLTGEPQTTN